MKAENSSRHQCPACRHGHNETLNDALALGSEYLKTYNNGYMSGYKDAIYDVSSDPKWICPDCSHDHRDPPWRKGDEDICNMTMSGLICGCRYLKDIPIHKEESV